MITVDSVDRISFDQHKRYVLEAIAAGTGGVWVQQLTLQGDERYKQVAEKSAQLSLTRCKATYYSACPR